MAATTATAAATPAHVDRRRRLLVALTGILTEAIGAIRERMDRLEDVDAVTADILHGVVAWMIRVQTA